MPRRRARFECRLAVVCDVVLYPFTLTQRHYATACMLGLKLHNQQYLAIPRGACRQVRDAREVPQVPLRMPCTHTAYSQSASRQ